MNHRYTTLLLLSALALFGCKKTATPTTAGAAPAAPAVDPATAGIITGKITFDGVAPKRVAIDMSMDPACAFATTPNMTEQVLVTDHALANIYVYIKSGIPASQAPASAAPVVLDQKGCRYIPHVIALQQGGSVEFRNSDPTMHNVHTTPADGSTPIDVSEGPMGAPQTQKVRCPRNHAARALQQPSLDDRDDQRGAEPLLRSYRPRRQLHSPQPATGDLHARRRAETLGEQDIQITVAPKATASANFAFKAK